jgi:hypothetical protein
MRRDGNYKTYSPVKDMKNAVASGFTTKVNNRKENI